MVYGTNKRNCILSLSFAFKLIAIGGLGIIRLRRGTHRLVGITGVKEIAYIYLSICNYMICHYPIINEYCTKERQPVWISMYHLVCLKFHHQGTRFLFKP